MRILYNYMLGSIFFFVPMNSYGYESGASISGVLARYENLDHFPVPVKPEWVESIRTSFFVTQESSEIVAGVDGKFELINYENGQNRDSNTGRLSGKLAWTISPRLLTWNVQDSYSDILITSLSNDSPSNRQGANIFSSGPTVQIKLGAVDNIFLDYRAERHTFSVTDADNDRDNFSANYLHNMNVRSTLSVLYENENVNYNADDLADYERIKYHFGLKYVENLNSFEVRVGETELLSKSGAEVKASTLFLAIGSKRTTTTNIRLEYTDNVTDTADNLKKISVDESGAIVNSATDLYFEKNAKVKFSKILSTGAFSVSVGRELRENDVTSALNETRKTAEIKYLWNITPTSNLSTSGSARLTNFDLSIPKREDNYRDYLIAYNYAIKRNISSNVEFQYLRKESTLIIENFDDMVVKLSLTYKIK